VPRPGSRQRPGSLEGRRAAILAEPKSSQSNTTISIGQDVGFECGTADAHLGGDCAAENACQQDRAKYSSAGNHVEGDADAIDDPDTNKGAVGTSESGERLHNGTRLSFVRWHLTAVIRTVESAPALVPAPLRGVGFGEEVPKVEMLMALVLTSPAFASSGSIPPRHTCEGEDVSPELRWEGDPSATKSFGLIVDDPDAPDPRAPKMTWVHWVVYDIPANVHVLPESAVSQGLPPGTKQGLNDWKRVGYGGPCPPIGTHRYFFKLYALDTVLPDLGRPTKAQLLNAMKGHVLEEAQLIGTYKKKG
jgi:Raf kinase inhibitor-like YbhB/YbcL family protein